MTYVTVEQLPACVRQALASVRYGRKDIEVCASKSLELGGSAGDGKRAFTVLVNLTTGRHDTVMGSWGGPNMFDRGNPVDNDTREYELPGDGVAVKGVMGGSDPTWARLHVPASMVDRMLPAAPVKLTSGELDALYCFKALKGGQYRKDALKRLCVTDTILSMLVESGLLSRNKAGAMAITTEGKNAVAGYQPSRYV